eukprot:TRINITY_DN1024_c0_g1_i1.p1 TRINITY_DN1024_c0_g1~~TRINITY_DN1024_c0_g1_i1.p1  ORF type:complete len:397 (-),score=167.70 TRINITY_DN1024_c0_g1_i1:119-1135(-)
MNDDGEMVYEEATLCSLSLGGQENTLLNAHFDEGDDVQFLVEGGNAPVYLTGNFIEPDFGDEDDSADEEEIRERLLESFSPEERAMFEKMSPQEQDQLLRSMLEDESDDEDFDSDDEEESDEEEEEGDEEESDEEDEMLAAKAAAAQVGQKRTDKAADTKSAKRAKVEEAKTPKKADAKTPKKADAKTPKKEEAKTPKKTEAKTPKKEEVKTPKGKTPDPKRQDTPTVKKLAGGLRVVDLSAGSGKEARKGASVTVSYIGRLAKGSKKVFDKSKSFSFRLGTGEVIKGWDVGVAGMKVGGKRKLLVPANMAYGARGAPPDIPGNSDLEFDVVLQKIKS